MKKQRVRAIIIDNGKILLIHRIFSDRDYWVFPGGAVEEGESLEVALTRECKEELGVDINILKLFAEEESGKKETKGYMEYFYEVEIVGGELGEGLGPEYEKNGQYRGKYDLIWEDIESILNLDLRPNIIRDKVVKNKKNI